MNYIHFYNKLIKLTTNKTLYKSLDKQDSFNDRLLVFLFHFAFFLKVKTNNRLITTPNGEKIKGNNLLSRYVSENLI